MTQLVLMRRSGVYRKRVIKMSEKEDKHVDIIKTYVMFGVDITVNIKVRKTTSYGSSKPEYTCAEIAGVDIPEDGFDWSNKDTIIRKIQEEAYDKVKKYEEEIKKEG